MSSDSSPERPSVREPWHVPDVLEDALADDLPPVVADAARRALQARRPGVAVARLSHPESVGTPHAATYHFSEGRTEVILALEARDGAVRLSVTCRRRPGAGLEVMHGGDTIRTVLDDTGHVEVPAVSGLVSVVIAAQRDNETSLQTTWIRALSDLTGRPSDLPASE